MYSLVFSALILFTVLIYLFLLVLVTYHRPVRLVYIMIYYVFIEKFLIYIGFPSYLSYGTDAIWVLMLAYLMLGHKKINLFKFAKWPTICAMLMFTVAVFSVILNINTSNFLWFLWHVRNYYRMIIFWDFCALWLKQDDIQKIMRGFPAMLLINVLFCTYQYFVLGYVRDYLGGTLGVTKGVNRDMNILLCIAAIYVITKYLNAEMKAPMCVIVLLGCMYIAILAELKIVFLELPIVVIGAAFLYRTSAKSIGLVTVSMFILIGSVYLIGVVFPGYSHFFNLSSIMEYAAVNYGDKTGLSRLTGAQTMFRTFLSTPIQKLFGIGAGNAGTAQFSFLKSNFANTYDGTLHYTWNYTAMIVVETGLAGLTTNIAFFISNIVGSIRTFRRGKSEVYLKMSLIYCMLIPFLLMYDVVLKSEMGFFAFFMLAISYAYRRMYEVDRANSEKKQPYVPKQ